MHDISLDLAYFHLLPQIQTNTDKHGPNYTRTPPTASHINHTRTQHFPLGLQYCALGGIRFSELPDIQETVRTHLPS